MVLSNRRAPHAGIRHPPRASTRAPHPRSRLRSQPRVAATTATCCSPRNPERQEAARVGQAGHGHESAADRALTGHAGVDRRPRTRRTRPRRNRRKTSPPLGLTGHPRPNLPPQKTPTRGVPLWPPAANTSGPAVRRGCVELPPMSTCRNGRAPAWEPYLRARAESTASRDFHISIRGAFPSRPRDLRREFCVASGPRPLLRSRTATPNGSLGSRRRSGGALPRRTDRTVE